jgi:endogenous inhibitor of DNA gyrase (YacG/DUF329 family)
VPTLLSIDCPHCGKPPQAETLSLNKRNLPCPACGKPIAGIEDELFGTLLAALAVAILGLVLFGNLWLLYRL